MKRGSGLVRNKHLAFGQTTKIIDRFDKGGELQKLNIGGADYLMWVIFIYLSLVIYRPCCAVQQATIKSNFIVINCLNFPVWKNLFKLVVNFQVFVFLCFKDW